MASGPLDPPLDTGSVCSCGSMVIGRAGIAVPQVQALLLISS